MLFLNSLEVVLPNGEVCKLGSCALSDYWFTRGPIPDFIGFYGQNKGKEPDKIPWCIIRQSKQEQHDRECGDNK